MYRTLIFATALAFPSTLLAQEVGPGEVQRVVACRGIADDAERLACYDREAAALDAAIETAEVVVVNKEQAQAAQRELFGFSTPNFAGLLGKDDKVGEVEVAIRNAQYNGRDKLLVEADDGSVWIQIDDRQIGSTPKSGTPITISRATLGSFEMKIEGRRSFKVRRVR